MVAHSLDVVGKLGQDLEVINPVAHGVHVGGTLFEQLSTEHHDQV